MDTCEPSFDVRDQEGMGVGLYAIYVPKGFRIKYSKHVRDVDHLIHMDRITDGGDFAVKMTHIPPGADPNCCILNAAESVRGCGCYVNCVDYEVDAKTGELVYVRDPTKRKWKQNVCFTEHNGNVFVEALEDVRDAFLMCSYGAMYSDSLEDRALALSVGKQKLIDKLAGDEFFELFARQHKPQFRALNVPEQLW
jgi:hypothetical protein